MERVKEGWKPQSLTTQWGLWLKLAITIICSLYIWLVWIFPVVLYPFVKILPYVHYADFPRRLAISSAGTASVICIRFLLDPKGFTIRHKSSETSLWGKTKHWYGQALFLVILIYNGAALSPNLFGAFARVLPATSYEEIVEVEKAAFHDGRKHNSVSLTLSSKSNESPLHLDS